MTYGCSHVNTIEMWASDWRFARCRMCNTALVWSGKFWSTDHRQLFDWRSADVPGYAAFLRDPYQLPDGFHAIWKADGRWYILCEDPPAVYTEIVRDKGSYVEAAMALKMELMRLIYGPPQAGGGSREVTYGRTDRGSAGTQDAHQRNRDDQAAQDQSLFRRGERERDGAANDGAAPRSAVRASGTARDRSVLPRKVHAAGHSTGR